MYKHINIYISIDVCSVYPNIVCIGVSTPIKNTKYHTPPFCQALS